MGAPTVAPYSAEVRGACPCGQKICRGCASRAVREPIGAVDEEAKRRRIDCEMRDIAELLDWIGWDGDGVLASYAGTARRSLEAIAELLAIRLPPRRAP